MGIFTAKKEAWQQVAKELGGDYSKGGILKSDQVKYSYKGWEIVLSDHSTGGGSSGQTRRETTTLSVPFVTRGDFRFKVYKENPFHEIGKFFKMQDIEIRDPEFDKRFIIKSNDTEMVRQLLNSPDIKEKIPCEEEAYFTIQEGTERIFGLPVNKKYPDGVYELTLVVPYKRKDVEELVTFFQLLAVTLDRLVKIGVAEKDAPALKE